MTDTGQQGNWTKLRRSLALTWAGLWAERITHAFWPVWTVLFVCIAALMLGLHDSAPVEAVWAAIVAAGAALAWYLYRGIRAFRIPRRMEALARMDARLPGRPISALLDKPAIGADDPASVALWRAHQARVRRCALWDWQIPPTASPRDYFRTLRSGRSVVLSLARAAAVTKWSGFVDPSKHSA